MLLFILIIIIIIISYHYFVDIFSSCCSHDNIVYNTVRDPFKNVSQPLPSHEQPNSVFSVTFKIL